MILNEDNTSDTHLWMEYIEGVSSLKLTGDMLEKFYLHYRSWIEVYDYIRAEICEIPKH